MDKIVIVGAGASGIITALRAKNDNNQVIILESNDKIGKKILLTGNGRCNYWNNDISINNYYTDSFDNLENILNFKVAVYDYLLSLGLYPKIKNGYYYPYSNQASSVVEILSKELIKSGIDIIYNYTVTSIDKINNKFIINNDIECDKLVISCGGCACPKTGSNGFLFPVLEKYHTVNKLLPSLVPLVGNESYFKHWNGIRVDSKLSAYVDDKLVTSELGEVLLTEYGISGIVTLNLSGIISRNIGNSYVCLDFLPEVDDLYTFLTDRSNLLSNSTIEEVLESIFPYKLMFIFLDKAKIDRNSYFNNLSEDRKNKLVDTIKNFKLNINSTLDFDRAQVTTGGVSLKEINSNTLESLKVPNLYLTGEVLDVDGKCGGFNLGFAFITGYLVGSDLDAKSKTN